MVQYFYLGSCQINSNDIVEMLEMCQEYMLNDLKKNLEQLLSGNIDADNFVDNIEIARAFDCNSLKEELYLFGQKNFKTLYQKGTFRGIT